jgi:hypothetical protein
MRWTPGKRLSVGIALALVVAALAIDPTPGTGPVGSGTDARSDLQNALTGVRTYQVDHGSLVGLTSGSSGITTIGTGLSFTSTASSTRMNLISIHLGRDNTYVVMTALQTAGEPGCFGILYVTARQPSPVLGETAKGTYFSVLGATAKADRTCNASTARPIAVSTRGFPAG